MKKHFELVTCVLVSIGACMVFGGAMFGIVIFFFAGIMLGFILPLYMAAFIYA